MDGMPESISRLYRDLDRARDERDAARAAYRAAREAGRDGLEEGLRVNRAQMWVTDTEDALAAREA